MKPGEIYRHYKGNVYRVICTARHSEDLSELVIYEDVNNPEKKWARPVEMWDEEVAVNGEKVKRFRKIEEE